MYDLETLVWCYAVCLQAVTACRPSRGVKCDLFDDTQHTGLEKIETIHRRFRADVSRALFMNLPDPCNTKQFAPQPSCTEHGLKEMNTQ